MIRFHLTLDVAESWIADGFDATSQDFLDLLRDSILGYATDDEKVFSARVSESTRKRIADLQAGTVKAMD